MKQYEYLKEHLTKLVHGTSTCGDDIKAYIVMLLAEVEKPYEEAKIPYTDPYARLR